MSDRLATPAMVAHDADEVLNRALARLAANDLDALITDAFTCNNCGAPLGNDMFCADYGIHHSQEIVDVDRLLDADPLAEVAASHDDRAAACTERRLHDAG